MDTCTFSARIAAQGEASLLLNSSSPCSLEHPPSSGASDPGLLFDQTKKGVCTHFLFLAVANALSCGVRDVQCSKNIVASGRWWVVCVLLGTRWPLSPMTWPGCDVVRQVVHSSDT